MRILFIHEVNYLSKPIFEMHETPERLAALGHDVCFLHFAEGLSRKEARDLGWIRQIRGRTCSEAEITLLTPALPARSIAGRLWAALMGWKIVRAAIAQARPDIIVTLAVPTFGWQAVMIAKELSIPIIYRALDVSSQIRKSVWAKIVSRAEVFVANRATAVSANNPAMVRYIQGLGREPESIAMHYPPMDLEHFQSGNRERGRKLIGASASDFLVLYMGSFFYFSGLVDVIVEFSRIAKDPSTTLILVGGGEQEEELRRLVQELNLERRVIFTGFVSYEKLPDYLSAADVLINPMKQEVVSNIAFPNKVIQYLMVGSRVVSTELDGLKSTFEGFENLFWSQTPAECIGKAIQFRDWNRASASPRNADRLRDSFGRGSMESYERFLTELTQGK